MSAIDLRLGDYRVALSDVTEVDALIMDPPYSGRTDKGYRSASDYNRERGRGRMSKRAAAGELSSKTLPRSRYELPYRPMNAAFAHVLIDFFLPRVRGWFVIFGDHESARLWESAMQCAGLVTFAPVPWIRTDSAPRFAGDGPATCAEWITIARPKGLPKVRGSRRGYYMGTHQGTRADADEKVVTGGKPLWLMRALVREYSERGDLIVDACAGGATTLLAAAIEGRRAIGSEIDPKTFGKAQARIARGYTPATLFEDRPLAVQLGLPTIEAPGGETPRVEPAPRQGEKSAATHFEDAANDNAQSESAASSKVECEALTLAVAGSSPARPTDGGDHAA